MTRRRIVLGIRIVAVAALTIYALWTPGFTSPISINALLNAISFIGCVAVGMTFITLTGNIMSLSLGATVSASALTFMASLSYGILPAFLILYIRRNVEDPSPPASRAATTRCSPGSRRTSRRSAT